MKRKLTAVSASLLILGLFFLVAGAFASDIKSRMMERLPVVKELKAKGVIGENNRGYLEFRGPKENGNVIAAENQDRKTVYAAIAKQQGVSLDVVEVHRAVMIEKKAVPGEWLQDANGKWYQK